MICMFIFSCKEPITKIIISNQQNTVIVKGKDASMQEENIIKLLQQKINEKTGILVPIIDEEEFSISATPFTNIIISGIPQNNFLLKNIMGEINATFPDKKEGFSLTTTQYQSKNIAIIAGSDALGMLYGTGKFLRKANYNNNQMSIEILKLTEHPLGNSRGLYLCMHTHNWYEDIPEIGKIEELIKEQGLLGQNTLWMWFDMSMYQKGPFEKNSDSYDKWIRFKKLAKAASNIGIGIGIIESANAVYLDQVNNNLKATKGSPPEGLLCPRANQGEAMKIMDDNYSEIYNDLRNDSINVISFSIFLYDRGGCQCNLCLPWIKTGVKYVGEHHAKIIKKYFPMSNIYLSDWHFGVKNGVDEIQWVKDYLKSPQADWISGVQKDDRHVWDRWNGIGNEKEVVSFLDITMIGGWSGYGANPFPARLDSMYNGMTSNNITSGLVYSEGIFDDINKVLFFGHYWEGYSSEKIIKEYAKWYFNMDEKLQQKLSDILFDMESEWTNIYGSWSSCSPLITNPDLNIKNRIDNLEKLLPKKVKKMWRWKLIHARANLAQLAVEISGLKGSGYNEFVSHLKNLSIANANMEAREKEICLDQKIELFDTEYNELYYGVYEGTKSGMYGAVPPNSARWIKGFNRGVKWKDLLSTY